MHALIPGSYDPIHEGHRSVIQRALRFCSHVTVGVFYNPQKKGLFTPEERVALIRASCPEDNISVIHDTGLLANRVQALDIDVIIKGIRSGEDLSYEMPMAHFNQQLSSAETLFLVSDPAVSFISSSLIRVIAQNSRDVSAYVPAPVAQALVEKFSQ